MSRARYTEDFDDYWQLIRWRGAVASAIRGRRGQEFLREMKTAMDAMPAKQLIAYDIDTLQGVCAIGSVTRSRKIDTSQVDLYDYDTIASMLDVAPALVREIEYENDEVASHNETPEQRFARVYQWVCSQIKEHKVG